VRRYKRVEVEAADDYKITLGGGGGRGGRGRRNNNEGGPSATAKDSKTYTRSDLLNKYKNLKPLSTKERKRYKKENLYNRYRKPGYFVYE